MGLAEASSMFFGFPWMRLEPANICRRMSTGSLSGLKPTDCRVADIVRSERSPPVPSPAPRRANALLRWCAVSLKRSSSGYAVRIAAPTVALGDAQQWLPQTA
jgi:hypothetical protein